MSAATQPHWRDWLLLASGSTYKFTLVGFYLVAVTTIFKTGGAGLKQLSWLYLLGSLEIGKVLFSTLIERYRIGHWGRFRGWLLLATIGIGVALGILLFLDPLQDFPVLLAACLLLSGMGVLYGCAMLGLSCVLLPCRDRGYGGVIQTVAARCGKMLGGALVLWLYQHQGWQAAIALMLVFNSLMLLQLWLYRETGDGGGAAGGFPLLLGRLFRFWQQPGSGWLWCVLLFLIGMPYAAMAATFVPRLGDLGFSASMIGTILAVVIPVACIVTAPVAGWLTRHYERLRVVRLLLLLQLPLLLSMLCLERFSQWHPWLPPLQMVLLSLAYTLLLPVMLALIMDKSARQTAALDSSLQFSIILAGTYTGGFLTLRVAAEAGYHAAYWGAFGLALAIAVVLFASRRCYALFQSVAV